MARILFAWELGSDYGHLARLLPVAMTLRARGHEPVFAVRDLMGAEALLTPHGFAAHQAPLWLGRLTNLPPPLHYAELLMRFGYLHAQALAGICRAWRHMAALLRPGLVVFDHAPTALLALRGAGLPRLNLGDGFCIPPPLQPLPPFPGAQPGHAARLRESEQRALATANAVLDVLGGPPLGALAELAGCDAQLLCTFPELDHYPARTDAEYVGPIFTLGQGCTMDWPGGAGPRVFAYLKPTYPALDAVLTALQASPARVLAHVPGAARQTLQRHATERLRFSDQALDMEGMRSQCDLAIGHGGAGTTAAMLLAGKPMLLLPMQMEQVMAARRVAALGAAGVVVPEAAAQFAQPLAHALADRTRASAAAAFAARHAGYDQAATVARVADRCEALLHGKVAA